MCDEEIAEPDVGKLILIRIVDIGTTVNVVSRRIRTSKIVPSGRETVLIVRG